MRPARDLSRLHPKTAPPLKMGAPPFDTHRWGGDRLGPRRRARVELGGTGASSEHGRVGPMGAAGREGDQRRAKLQLLPTGQSGARGGPEGGLRGARAGLRGTTIWCGGCRRVGDGTGVSWRSMPAVEGLKAMVWGRAAGACCVGTCPKYRRECRDAARCDCAISLPAGNWPS